jgi:predicted enzyme related to lactoylglutathione lyase
MDTPGLGQLRQISQTVQDLPRAVSFYRDVLGIRFLFEVPPRMAFFDCAGVRLMLSTPEPGFDHGSSALYFAVDDIMRARDTLAGRGVRFRTEPHTIARLADREVWLAEFSDTEGNPLALMSESALGGT